MQKSSKLQHSYWVVVPAYNEEKYLAKVLKKIGHYTSHIIVVDDGSSDQTATIASQYTAHVLKHRVNLGKGAALTTGCEYAFSVQDAQAVFFLDSDDQHDPHELILFQEQLLKGYDIVFGIRGLTKDMPLVKRMGNIFISIFIYILFGKYFSDVLSGYKAFTKEAYHTIRWETHDYAVELEIAVRVARSLLKRKGVIIKTIYHDHDRGMTLLDAMHFITLLINWRLSI
ncbi:MAG TPA: glycosyltransferase family 2 protein [Patescibacteria group bacterium]